MIGALESCSPTPFNSTVDPRISGPHLSGCSVYPEEKRTLPGAPAGVSEFACVAAAGIEAQSASRFGNVNPIPGLSGLQTGNLIIAHHDAAEHAMAGNSAFLSLVFQLDLQFTFTPDMLI